MPITRSIGENEGITYQFQKGIMSGQEEVELDIFDVESDVTVTLCLAYSLVEMS